MFRTPWAATTSKCTRSPIRLQSTAASSSLLSAVHRGVHFEDRSITLLREHLSMSLKRVGGKGDGGVDMLGWWWVPNINMDLASPMSRRRIRILAQCKAEKKKMGPKYVRELEGVLHRYHLYSRLYDDAEMLELEPRLYGNTHHKQVPSVGVLISESPFTKATLLHAQSSPIPLLLLHLPPEEEKDSSTSGELNCIGSAIWNPALAGEHGLLGGHMEIRWERSIKGLPRPGLWWQQSKLPSWTPSDVASLVP